MGLEVEGATRAEGGHAVLARCGGRGSMTDRGSRGAAVRFGAPVASLLAAAISLLVLIGWALDNPILMRVFPGAPAMAPNTAVGLLLASLSLWLQANSRGRWRLTASRTCACAAALLALLTLWEYARREDLGIDQLLFRDPSLATGTSFPGRMAVVTAVCFVLLGAALLLSTRRRAGFTSELLALVPGLFALVFLTGYIYGARSPEWAGRSEGMAIHTAVAFLLLSAGSVLARPDRGLARMVSSDTAGGMVARRILPVALVAPIILGWLRIAGQRQGLYSNEFGQALFVVSNAIVLLGVLLVTAAALARADEERRRSVEAFEDSEQRYRELAHRAPIGIYRSTREGRFLSVNESFVRLLGYDSAEEMLQLDIARDIYFDIAERERLIAENERLGGITGYESRLKRRDGSPVWVRIDTRAIFDESDRAESFEGFVHDITERKRTQEALQRAEEQYRLLFENSPQPMWVVDRETLRYLAVNDAAVEHYGYSRDEFLSMNIEQIRPAEDVPGLLRAIPREGTGLERTGIWRHLKKDGTVIHVEITTHTLTFAGRSAWLVLAYDVTDRLRAEEALRKSELQFSLAFQASPIATSIVEAATGKFRDVNDQFVRVLGYSREELIGRTSVELGIWGAPEDRERLWERVRKDGIARDEQVRVRTRSGEIRDVLGSMAPVDVGGVACVLTTFDDVTERRRAEEATRRSEERFRLLLDSTAEAIYGLDLEGNCTFCNPASARMLGYDRPEDLLGKNMHQLAHHTRADGSPFPLTECPVYQSIHTGRGTHVDNEVLWRADGTSFFAEYWSYPIWLDGQLVGAVMTFLDITQRRLAEDSIQRLSRAVEQARNAIFMTDSDGAITYVNPAFEAIYGYSREETLGKTPRILKSGQHDRAYYKRFWQSLLAGESIREEFVNKTRVGRLVTVEASVSPVLDAQGKRVGFIAVQDDVTDRKRAEEALRKSEKRFSLAFHASPIPTSISEWKTGRLLDVNEEFIRSLGYRREELVGRTAIEAGIWVDPAERKRFGARLARGGIAQDETQIRTRSGQVRDIVGSSVRIEVGSIPCVLSTFLDITERKRAEKEVRKSEERFRRLFDSNTIGIVIADLSGRTLEASDSYLSMLGYTREELTAGTIRWDELTPLEHRAGDERAIEELRRTGVAQPWEKELIRKDGTRVPVLIGVAMLGESEGNCIAYIVDLTERRRAEEALRQSEERFRRAFSSSPVAMTLSDPKTGLMVDVNERLAGMLGYAREELIGHSSLEMGLWVDPAERARVVADVEASIPVREREIQLRTKKGEIRYVLDSVEPLQVGKERALLSAFQDVTERRQLENQLRQAQKMEAVGQLAGGIAHDFNNLLTAILGYSELLATEIGARSPLLESVDEIRKAGERAAGLTRQLLAFSRRQVLEPKVLNVNALVANLDRMLGRLIGEDIHLFTVLDPSVGRIHADAGQVEQVLMNLAVNARDAMPRGGKLTIETSNVELDDVYAREHMSVRPGSYVMLAMTDTGAGMSAETMSHIFEPFFTTKVQGKGTGLGLATVYGIIKQSGGYIWVYSEPGRGTSFKVYLPRVEGKAKAEGRVAPASKPSTQDAETILLVEDDPSVRTLTHALLEAKGYQVLEASGAEEAIAAVRRGEGPIQLLLTDVVMPDMDGSDLSARIVALRPDIKVLYMSGYTDDAVIRHGLVADSVSFLQKPFTPDSLARKVREVLDSDVQ